MHTVVYPLARVEVEETHEVEAAVSETLPVSMLMGTVLKSLVKNDTKVPWQSWLRKTKMSQIN